MINKYKSTKKYLIICIYNVTNTRLLHTNYSIHNNDRGCQKMVRTAVLRVCAVIAVCCVCFTIGCSDGGSDSPTDPNGNNGNNGGNGSAAEPAPGMLIPDDDHTILCNADDRFEELVLTKTYEQARIALVDELQGTDGIENARLMTDGVGIFVDFSDGYNGLVSTYDIDALNEGLDSIDYGSLIPQKTVRSVRSMPKAVNNAAGHGMTPDSRKVIILNVCANSLNTEPAVDRVISMLKEKGWEDKDITSKTRKTDNDTTIEPMDLLKLGEYGLIFILAHGHMDKLNDYGMVHWIECSGLPMDPANPNSAMYALWEDMDWITSSSGSAYIMNPLLESEMDDLPNSIVCLISCYGWYGTSAFLSNGAQSITGWDHAVLLADGVMSFYQYVWHLLLNDPPRTALEAYNEDTTYKYSEGVLDSPAYLHIAGNNTSLLAPAWGTITIPAGSVPSTVDELDITISDGSNTIFQGNTKTLTEIGLDSLAPVDVDIAIQSRANGEKVAERKKHYAISPGNNDLAFDFSSQIARGQLLKHTYLDSHGYSWGPYTTLYIRYYVWKKNPEGNSYTITYHHDSKGFDGNPYTVTQPSPGDDFKHEMTPLDSGQVAAIWGSDIFGLGPDDIVMFQYGSMYAHHMGESEISDWITESDEREGNGIKSQWYEVYNE